MTENLEKSVDTQYVPTFKQPRNKRINVRVTKDEKEWIDNIANAHGGNASDVIRDALHVYKDVLDGGDSEDV